MHTEFRKVRTPDEMRRLLAFDRKVFHAADTFPADYWMELESYWMLAGNATVGCCAFERDADFGERKKGSLYIATTGILPRYQGLGYGQLLKCWEICFARYHGFRRVVTNTRSRNRAMIDLNRKFGFEVIRTVPLYYSSPTDSTVIMELRLKR